MRNQAIRFELEESIQPMSDKYQLAKPLLTSQWFNTDKPLGFEDFRGRVTVVCVFQVLCPSCVSHAIPQAKRVRELFAEEDVAVIGLHTIFKRHDEQPPEVIERFIKEQNITFPVALDEHQDGERLGETMKSHEFRGTPTMLLLDRDGNLRKKGFGSDGDMQLGAEIMALLRDRETGLQYTDPNYKQPAA
jgi:peroxiredoxin